MIGEVARTTLAELRGVVGVLRERPPPRWRRSPASPLCRRWSTK